MTTTKKRFRMGAAVATATLTALSVLALAAPASANAQIGPPRNVLSDADGRTTTTLKVRWQTPDTGTQLAFLNGFSVSFNGPLDAVFPAVIDPDEVIVNVPAVAGQVDYSATGTALKPGTFYVITVTANVPGFQESAASLLRSTDAAPIVPPAVASCYAPFTSWDALVRQNYLDFLGRQPRLDELVFWTQKLAASPQLPVYATGNNWELKNPNGTGSGLFLTGARTVQGPSGNTSSAVGYGTFRANNGAANALTNPYITKFPDLAPLGAVNRVYITESGQTRITGTNAPVAFLPTKLGCSSKVRGDFLVFLYEEARQTYGPAVRLYNAFFPGRLGDYKGIEFWRNKLALGTKPGGWDLERISNFFTKSDEFVATYETQPDGTIRPLDDAEFVALVYVNVLKRPADGPGVAFWTRQLSEGKRTRGGVMTGFSESQEYRRLTSSEVQTTVLVNSLRESAPTETDIVRAKEVAKFGLGTIPTPSRLALLLDAQSFLPVEEPTATAEYPWPADNESFAYTHQQLVTALAYLERIKK